MSGSLCVNIWLTVPQYMNLVYHGVSVCMCLKDKHWLLFSYISHHLQISPKNSPIITVVCSNRRTVWKIDSHVKNVILTIYQISLLSLLLLAHLSRRLICELIGYSRSCVRPSSSVVHNALGSSSPKPLCQFKAKFYVKPL